MDKKKFHSGELARVSVARLPQPIKQAHRDLERAFPNGRLQRFKWLDGYIAIRLELDVELTTRRTASGECPILTREPILIGFQINGYPYRCPKVFSDRKDFPHWQLPHLYLTRKGLPTRICLLRNNEDDWFAEHGIIELIDRAQRWFTDAAAGELDHVNRDWEPLRIEEDGGQIQMSCVDLWQDIAQSRAKGDGGAFLRIAKGVNMAPSQDEPGKWIVRPLPGEVAIENVSKERLSFVATLNREASTKGHPPVATFCMVLYAPEAVEHREYLTALPTRLDEFQEWCDQYNFPCSDSIAKYLQNNRIAADWLPITLVFKRPANLVDKDYSTESISFLIEIESDDELGISANSRVVPLSHYELFRPAVARIISGRKQVDAQRVLAVGCGALGSKIWMHVGRSGAATIDSVDYDKMLGHNLTRHALYRSSVGRYKAEEVANQLNGLFDDLDHEQVPRFFNVNLSNLVGNNSVLQELKARDYQRVFDATASSAVRTQMAELDLGGNQRVTRFEIAAAGEIGILSHEGASRNPRVDDLLIETIAQALIREDIAAWMMIRRDDIDDWQQTSSNEIELGLGCSTATMVLADDVISAHAAAMAKNVANIMENEPDHGKIVMGNHNANGAMSITETIVLPTIIREDSDWEIRISAVAEARIRELMSDAGRKEVGGYLAGRVDQNNRTIYVARALGPPPDSIMEEARFVLGTDGVDEAFAQISQNTGEMLYEVGTWHSHPQGCTSMSDIDVSQMRKMTQQFAVRALPALIIIADRGSVAAHVNDQERPRYR